MARWSTIAEQLMEHRYPALLAYANMVTGGDRAAAEDLVHDAFVRSFGRGKSFDSLTHAEYYVRRAILSVFLDGARRSKRHRALLGRIATPESHPSHEDGVSSADQLRRLLAELTPQERACAVLRYVDDLTVDATAARLGLAPGTVKRYLANASARLNSALGTEPEDESPPRVAVIAHSHPAREEH